LQNNEVVNPCVLIIYIFQYVKIYNIYMSKKFIYTTKDNFHIFNSATDEIRSHRISKNSITGHFLIAPESYVVYICVRLETGL